MMNFIKGLSIGFILGILLAPDSGAATRRKLTRIGTDIRDDVEDTYTDISNSVADKVSQIKDEANELMHTGQQGYSSFASSQGRL